MKAKKSLRSDESGIVAIVVTVFFMVVLSLIVLNFSQSSRREQRQSLDDQLSSQAFYAAESGINETVRYIKAHITEAGFPIEKTKCDASELGTFTTDDPDGVVGDNGNISYSCVLFDRSPRTIVLDKLDTEDGKFVSLDTDGPTKTITLSWKESDSKAEFTDCPSSSASAITSFPTQKDYTDAVCDAGMIRVMLMSVQSGNGVDRESLSAQTFTVFFRPTKDAGASGSVDYKLRGSTADDGKEQGQVIAAPCSAGSCKATIELGSASPGSSGKSLYGQFRSIYTKNDLTIGALKSNGDASRFVRSQIMVDVTGKANDVLRRLQVRVPLYEDYRTTGGFVLDSGAGVCKRISVFPGSSTSTECGGATYFD